MPGPKKNVPLFNSELKLGHKLADLYINAKESYPNQRARLTYVDGLHLIVQAHAADEFEAESEGEIGEIIDTSENHLSLLKGLGMTVVTHTVEQSKQRRLANRVRHDKNPILAYSALIAPRIVYNPEDYVSEIDIEKKISTPAMDYFSWWNSQENEPYILRQIDSTIAYAVEAESKEPFLFDIGPTMINISRMFDNDESSICNYIRNSRVAIWELPQTFLSNKT